MYKATDMSYPCFRRSLLINSGGDTEVIKLLKIQVIKSDIGSYQNPLEIL